MAAEVIVKKMITFVTGNPHKLKEVVNILGVGDNFPFEFQSIDLDLPEYQGEPDEIAHLKCKAATELVTGPVVIEDTCLNFNALGGLPGPYIKWFYNKLHNEGLHRLLAGWEDKSAQAICTIAYFDGKQTTLLKGIINGTIVEPRGPPLFGWDNIFVPEGYDKTYAELGPAIKDTISHRYRALVLFREHLIKEARANA